MTTTAGTSCFEILGVGDGNRTRNVRSHSPVLCQLSYSHRRPSIITTGVGGGSAFHRNRPRGNSKSAYQLHYEHNPGDHKQPQNYFLRRSEAPDLFRRN